MNYPRLLLRARIKALVLGLCLCAPAFSQITLVSDNFSTVNKSGSSGPTQIATSGTNTYYQLASAWSYNNIVANSGVLSFVNAYSTGYIQFQPVTLTNTGDYLTLSFTLAYPTAPADVASGFRFSLYNTSGNINTALYYDASTNAVGDTAKGYYITTNPGTTATSNTSLAKDLGNQLVTSGGAVNSNANGSALTVASFTHSSAFSATPQTITMTFTKTASGVSIATSLGGDSSTYTDTSSPYTTFDTFFFASGNLATQFNIDDLSITTNVSAIPEPAAVAQIFGLIALAGTAVWRRSQRRRRAE